MNWLLQLLGGGLVEKFTGPLLQAYHAKLSAQNDAERIEAELYISRLESARDIALAEAGRAWSATSVGRWLIVVPFGFWWAAIFLVQIVNPWLAEPIAALWSSDWRLVVIDVPPRVHDMAMILVPAIVIADVGAFAARQLGGRL